MEDLQFLISAPRGYRVKSLQYQAALLRAPPVSAANVVLDLSNGRLVVGIPAIVSTRFIL